MKVITLSALILVILIVVPAMAEEGSFCNYYFKNVQRKFQNINSYGNDLSGMAKNQLFKDLKHKTKQCIRECEGQEFKYCNEIAKWISKN